MVTATEMMALKRIPIMRFYSLMVVSHFLEVARVRRVIYYTRDCAGILLNNAKTLMIADET